MMWPIYVLAVVGVAALIYLAWCGWVLRELTTELEDREE